MKQFILKRRKKLEKRAFTIVETLAIIVILGVMAIITIPNIAGIYENHKLSREEKVISLIESAAETYDINSSNRETETIITIANLLEEGYVTPELLADTEIDITDPKYAIHKHIVDGEVSYDYVENADEIVIEDPVPPFSTFTSVFGGTETDTYYCLIRDNDEYIVVGNAYSNDLDLSGLNRGSYDATLVKYDINGDLLWFKIFGGNGLDLFNSVIKTSDGYIAAGKSSSTSGDLSGLSKGNYDAVVVKYDTVGNIIWNKNFGGSALDEYNVVIEVSGGYIAVGRSSSTTDDLAGLNKGGYDGIIVKYDTDGNVLWNKNFGGTGSDYFYSLVSVGDDIIVIGTSSSTDLDLDGLNKGSYDSIIVKYDANGNLLWNKNFGGTGTEYFRQIKEANDELILVGHSASVDDDLLGLNISSTDAIIVKYDTSGNLLWNKNFGGNLTDYFYDLDYVEDGYVVTGYSNSTTDYLVDLNKGDNDAVVVKYDTNGNLLWNKNVGGTGNDYFFKIIKSGNGYVAVGKSDSNDLDLSGLNKGNLDSLIFSGE